MGLFYYKKRRDEQDEIFLLCCISSNADRNRGALMIEAYTGYPGSGKSFALTYRAYKAMKQKRNVYSSYYIKGAYKLTFDDLVNFTFPKGSVVIIDESGRWFNSRNWQKLPSEVFDLFTLHRHMQLDLIVAVQNFNRIDVALREVIELVWWARNLWYLPIFVYDGYYDVDKLGMKGEANTRSYVGRYTRARKLYDTHAMSKTINKDIIPKIPWTEDPEALIEGVGDSVEGVAPEELETPQQAVQSL